MEDNVELKMKLQKRAVPEKEYFEVEVEDGEGIISKLLEKSY